jgi:hypothetical protein
MINHFHIQAHNCQNPRDDDNMLVNPRDVVITTQLQNYINLNSTTELGEVWMTFSKSKRPQLTRPCHSAPEIIRLITNHLVLNHTRLATFKSTKSMLETRNKVLPYSTTLNNNGIQIYGRLISHFLTTIINGGQGVHVTVVHSTRSMPITLIGYPIFIRNEGIHARLVENGSFYNIVCIKLVEILEGNQYNDFKAILASSHYQNSWFFKWSKLTNWFFLSIQHVHFD